MTKHKKTLFDLVPLNFKFAFYRDGFFYFFEHEPKDSQIGFVFEGKCKQIKSNRFDGFKEMKQR